VPAHVLQFAQLATEGVLKQGLASHRAPLHEPKLHVTVLVERVYPAWQFTVHRVPELTGVEHPVPVMDARLEIDGLDSHLFGSQRGGLV